MVYYVYDSSTLSLILRRDPSVRARAEQVAFPDVVLGCPIVWYELRRGLLARDARKQLERFEALFATFVWQDYTSEDWSVAAQLWADRRAQGRPIGDADLFIAVFARNRDAILVTDNEKDFSGLGITVENWTHQNGSQ